MLSCHDEHGKLTTISKALERKARDGVFKGTCRECGRRVYAHREGKNGMAAHFEHAPGEWTAECSLADPKQAAFKNRK
jgi:hypothetical protein